MNHELNGIRRHTEEFLKRYLHEWATGYQDISGAALQDYVRITTELCISLQALETASAGLDCLSSEYADQYGEDRFYRKDQDEEKAHGFSRRVRMKVKDVYEFDKRKK